MLMNNDHQLFVQSSVEEEGFEVGESPHCLLPDQHYCYYHQHNKNNQESPSGGDASINAENMDNPSSCFSIGRPAQRQAGQQQQPFLSRFRRVEPHTTKSPPPSQSTPRSTQQQQQQNIHDDEDYYYMESPMMLRCPCYAAHQESFEILPNSKQQRAAIEVITTTERTHHQRIPSREKSLLTAAESFDEDESSSSSLGTSQQQQELTGVLDSGNMYTISKIVVEGSLHKKGTGKDWMGSRGWKARWARLALGRVEGYGDLDVPLLCVSWYRTSAVTSNVIVLDGTVILKSDAPETSKWNQYRFDIRHAATANDAIPVFPTRTFTAPSRKARDAWVYTISHELLSFEKQKAQQAVLRRDERRLSSGYRNRRSQQVQRLTLEDGWTTNNSQRSPSRPSSPSHQHTPFPKVPRSPTSPRTVIPERPTSSFSSYDIP